MADKWVDSSGYFGPDRRRRAGRKPWKDRRHLDEAGKPPALGALLRRLRVQMTGIAASRDRGLALQLLRAAINEAERLQYGQCADALKAADRILKMGTPAEIPQADSYIAVAADHAANCL